MLTPISSGNRPSVMLMPISLSEHTEATLRHAFDLTSGLRPNS
jgi:hypothetical protein